MEGVACVVGRDFTGAAQAFVWRSVLVHQIFMTTAQVHVHLLGSVVKTFISEIFEKAFGTSGDSGLSI